MTKLGVRFLGLLFIVEGISQFYTLITGLVTNGLDFGGFIFVCLLLYAGLYLWLFEESGRIWALLISWLRVLFLAYYFLVILPSAGPVGQLTGEIRAPLFHWSTKVIGQDGVFITLGLAIFEVSVIYFLTRKNTKLLFQKPIDVESNPQPITPQDSTHAQ